jgi:endonuclease YncB( thermonuclease family)
LVLSGERYRVGRLLKLTPHSGIRAPRTTRNASEKSEPHGLEAAEFSTHRFLQRDVEFEVDAVDKSGGFIGALYLNKTENAAVVLAREGFATVHSSSADGLSWVRQLHDAEVSSQLLQVSSQLMNRLLGRSQSCEAKCTCY